MLIHSLLPCDDLPQVRTQVIYQKDCPDLAWGTVLGEDLAVFKDGNCPSSMEALRCAQPLSLSLQAMMKRHVMVTAWNWGLYVDERASESSNLQATFSPSVLSNACSKPARNALHFYKPASSFNERAILSAQSPKCTALVSETLYIYQAGQNLYI